MGIAVALRRGSRFIGRNGSGDGSASCTGLCFTQRHLIVAVKNTAEDPLPALPGVPEHPVLGSLVFMPDCRAIEPQSTVAPAYLLPRVLRQDRDGLRGEMHIARQDADRHPC